MPAPTNEKARLIAALNDRFRSNLLTGAGVPGQTMLTRGITALPDALKLEALARVQEFSAFTPDNDPHGEHDCAGFALRNGERVLWKIDYYADRGCEWGAEDASAAASWRVLTIMLASEY
jgi:hypothetical protein